MSVAQLFLVHSLIAHINKYYWAVLVLGRNDLRLLNTPNHKRSEFNDYKFCQVAYGTILNLVSQVILIGI